MQRPATGDEAHNDQEELIAFLEAHSHLSHGSLAAYNFQSLSLPGLSVEVSISAMPTESDCPGGFHPRGIEIVGTGESGYEVNVGEKVKVLALETEDGKLLAFFLEAPVEQYDQFQAEAQQVLDSLTFQ